MRAKYDIYSVQGNRVVARSVIDVSSDPNSSDNRSVALYSWGYDPDEVCADGRKPIYRAVFIDYVGGCVDVPAVLVEEIEQLMTDVPITMLRQTAQGRALFLRLKRISNMLFESGCTDSTLTTS